MMHIEHYKLGERILIIGCAGAGKTTLSKQLSKKLQLPMIHLDKHFWNKNWGKPREEDWQETVQQLCERKNWIMDGNYTDILPLRLKHATSIIFLDTPRWRCLIRVIIRRFRFFHNKKRVDIAEGCKERLSFEFYRWIWNYPKRSRGKTFALLDGYSGPKFCLKNNREVKNLIYTAHL
ncbi:MAG: AAA family ATPase [Gammaproteobacteria bacterium]|nr:AAA family ATPase [Gammaproteobacteria bacterium]